MRIEADTKVKIEAMNRSVAANKDKVTLILNWRFIRFLKRKILYFHNKIIFFSIKKIIYFLS